MRHGYHKYKLNRTKSHRIALRKNMASSLVEHERIKTTLVKAKFLRPYFERLVTLAKKGDLHARRLLSARLNSEDAAKKMLENVSVRYKDRAGGYLRIIKLGTRKGDNAEMALVEMV